mmetsp:Transcript_17709/g.59728  ORF Transcript_17709/g.59728 Transcript_17709/m.59728 type:complete len:257 (+) Transcript_17709:303-1073(+)
MLKRHLRGLRRPLLGQSCDLRWPRRRRPRRLLGRPSLVRRPRRRGLRRGLRRLGDGVVVAVFAAAAERFKRRRLGREAGVCGVELALHFNQRIPRRRHFRGKARRVARALVQRRRERGELLVSFRQFKSKRSRRCRRRARRRCRRRDAIRLVDGARRLVGGARRRMRRVVRRRRGHRLFKQIRDALRLAPGFAKLRLELLAPRRRRRRNGVVFGALALLTLPLLVCGVSRAELGLEGRDNTSVLLLDCVAVGDFSI